MLLADSYNVINEFDMVPRLSFGTLKDLCDNLGKVHEDITVGLGLGGSYIRVFRAGQRPEIGSRLPRDGLFEKEGSPQGHLEERALLEGDHELQLQQAEVSAAR